MLQEYCTSKRSVGILRGYRGNTAGITLVFAFGRTFPILPEYIVGLFCRNAAGIIAARIVWEYCRNIRAVLEQDCKKTAGIL